ncbi:MAG: hypothetical protein KDB58_13875 [Solirubrobacterales bacterium]|nr:hypothetical protein [Solirubrobacterales bacterium]
MTLAVPELSSPEAVAAHLTRRGDLCGVVIEAVDLRECGLDWDAIDVSGSAFLACTFPGGEAALAVQANGAVVIPDLSEGRPFRVYPSGLYTYESLAGNGVDAAIEAWFHAHPEPMEPVEAIAQRMHDTAMTDAINELIRPTGEPARRVVGVMGGHAVTRDTGEYEQVVHLGIELTRAGFFVATGGGPGVMEAANLGAYLTREGPAEEGPDPIAAALATLREAPGVDDPGYGDVAERVHAVRAGARGGESLAIPTWLYTHEPVGRFATHIAKYFANSIREDGLLRLAEHGVIFGRGGAGTIQEVFQDAALNAYAPPHRRVPMVFLGSEFFAGNGVWDVLGRQAAAADPPYGDLLLLTDEVKEAVAFITRYALDP